MREKYESLSLTVLKDVAKSRGLKNISAMKKADLVELMLADDEREKKAKAAESVAVEDTLKYLDSGEAANGILEVMPDGYGFIRCENYLPV